jgi:acyl dehydratase
MQLTDRPPLVFVGETPTKTLRFSREDIVTFARLTGDSNPLHTDPDVARRARFGDIIASGQQTSAALMGLLATYFSRAAHADAHAHADANTLAQLDGIEREMLCLNMNFAFKHPVFADQDIALQWRVASIDWKDALRGCLVQLDGSATVAADHAADQVAVVARGTILVKERTA